MIREITENSYGVEGRTTSKKWCSDFSLMCSSREQLPYAVKCLEYLDDLPEDVEKRLAKYLYRYYKDFEEYMDEDEIREMGVTEENVFEHVRVYSVIVDDNTRQDRIEFHTEGGVDWEPEHGLEFTISDGKILYVGPFDDYPPNSSRLAYALEHYGYYDPEGDMQMNYASKE